MRLINTQYAKDKFSDDLSSNVFQHTVQKFIVFIGYLSSVLAASVLAAFDTKDSVSDIDPSQADGNNDSNISNYYPVVDDVTESETLNSGSAKIVEGCKKTNVPKPP